MMINYSIFLPIIFFTNFLSADFNSSECFCKKKIAFVKQVVYQDLYCASKDESINDIIFSSFFRSGPVALFTRFDVDFFIVELEPDKECNIWKETTLPTTECKFKREILEKLRYRVPEGRSYPQGFYVTKCEDIDWSLYEIVITINCAVPARITSKYPKILWTYYIGEHTTPSHAQSLIEPIPGYDIFLTQDFFYNRVLPNHVIEFPYQLHYYGCFHELLKKKRSEHKKGIHLETWTMRSLSPQKKDSIANIVDLRNSKIMGLRDFIIDLTESKYFIVFLSENCPRKNLRGNCVPEAIAAGCLVIAKDGDLLNNDLLSPRTKVSSFSELIELLKFFEKNPKVYDDELCLQRKKLDELCFLRPIRELFYHAEQKLKK